jgi:LacI family transcriptional regulator
MKKATIKDIASYVGVSVTTVSNVINGKEGKVSAETIDKIQEAIKKFDYIPNLSARSLVNNKSKLIGVIIPQTEDCKQLLLENPFYSEMVSNIEAKIRQNGYYMILSGVNKGSSYLDVFVRWNLDGAIIMGIYHEKFYEELKRVRIPIVMVDSYLNDDYFCNVGIDDEYGGYLPTKYLIEKGHKNIALVTGSIKKDGVTEKRFLGYKKALKEAGIYYNPEYVFEKAVTYEHGFEAGNIITKKYKEITGVFATADLIAAGVIGGAKQNGANIPEDLSVIGFDDIFISKMIVPPLTTVRQNIGEKGAKAAELVIDMIEKEGNDVSKEVILPLEIMERQSVRKID